MRTVLVFVLSMLTPALYAADWTPWVTIYSESIQGSAVRIQISFKLTGCNGKSLRGQSYYRINNEFKRENAFLVAKFAYLTCDGETGSESFTVDMSRYGIYESPGNWFMGYRVTQAYFDVQINDYNRNNASSRPSSSGGSTPVTRGQTDEWYFPSRGDLDSGRATPDDIRVPNTGTNEIYYPSREELERQKALERIQSESERIQRQYEQTQRELRQATDVSMQAYERAAAEGHSESFSIAKGVLEGASQISDPGAALAYTGVGLVLSLLSGSGESKQAEHQRTVERYDREIWESRMNRIKLQQEEQLLKTKRQFLEEAKAINQYSVGDLVNSKRYVSMMLVPNLVTAEKQDLYFSVPILTPTHSDGTYLLKREVESRVAKLISGQVTEGMSLVVLYPIVHPDKFISDFTKKMGSGTLLNFNPAVINLSLLNVEEVFSTGSVEKAAPAAPKGKKDSFWDY